jgi:ribose transport system substrate-binding protein
LIIQNKLSRRRCAAVVAGAAFCASVTMGVAAPSATAANLYPETTGTAVQIAYLSFAVANNAYDSAMLAASTSTAEADGAALTVFDAGNSSTIQYTQLQDAIMAHKYQGIIVQPIFGTALLGLVRQAIAAHIQVADLDQELGPNLGTDKPQVKGLAANVVFVPTKIGQKLGALVVRACATHNLCQVGYIYDVKASALDGAIYRGFSSATARHANVKIVAQGQSYFTPWNGLIAAQHMLQSDPNLTLIVGSDQGIEGAQKAVAGEGKTGKVVLVGYGASAAALSGVRSGAWYGDVAQLPASEGRLAVEDLIKTIRTGVASGAADPVAQLPGSGVITKSDVGQFHAEWPG